MTDTPESLRDEADELDARANVWWSEATSAYARARAALSHEGQHWSLQRACASETRAAELQLKAFNKRMAAAKIEVRSQTGVVIP